MANVADTHHFSSHPSSDAAMHSPDEDQAWSQTVEEKIKLIFQSHEKDATTPCRMHEGSATPPDKRRPVH